MKKLILFAVSLVFLTTAFAQPTKEEILDQLIIESLDFDAK